MTSFSCLKQYYWDQVITNTILVLNKEHHKTLIYIPNITYGTTPFLLLQHLWEDNILNKKSFLNLCFITSKEKNVHNIDKKLLVL